MGITASAAAVRPGDGGGRRVVIAFDVRLEDVSTLTAELSPSERDLYDALRLAARKDVVEKLEKGASVLAALEALLRSG